MTGLVRHKISWKQVANACGKGWSQKEICDFIGCGIFTIKRRCKKENGIPFKEFYIKHSHGKTNYMGRPKILLDWGLIAEACAIQCTEVEVANFFGISIDSLNRRCKEENDITFKEFKQRNSEGGKMSLRRTQFLLARSNAQMAIHLGKNYLGQANKLEVTHVIIDNVSQICSDILIKYIGDPDKLRLAAEEFQSRVSEINQDKKEIQYVESEEE